MREKRLEEGGGEGEGKGKDEEGGGIIRKELYII